MATQLSQVKAFGGLYRRYVHQSAPCRCKMTFGVFTPSDTVASPVLVFLAGLTCTDENFAQKAGAFRVAAELGLALVMPDTSPRGLDVAGEAEAWDFGVGAGFYLNATEQKWAAWRMDDYVSTELPACLASLPGLDVSRLSLMGHSMGGHGALVLALRSPLRYRSVSCFAPICHPSVVPWGVKAFTGYLGSDGAAWKAYDATELLKSHTGPAFPLLVDVGSADNFLAAGQLKPEDLEQAATAVGFPLTLRMQAGYDHSYHFIASFVEDHLRFHAAHLIR